MSYDDVFIFGDREEMQIHVHNPRLGHLHATVRAVPGHVLEHQGPSDVIRRFRVLMHQGYVLDGVDQGGHDVTKVTYTDRVYGSAYDHVSNPYLEVEWFPPKPGAHQALMYQLVLMLWEPHNSLSFRELTSGVDVNDPPTELLPFLQPAA